jgi:hypothetical protein
VKAYVYPTDAAADAYAGLRIFDLLERKRRSINPLPSFPPCRIFEEIGGTGVSVISTEGEIAESGFGTDVNIPTSTTASNAPTISPKISGIGDHETSTELAEILSEEIAKAQEWITSYVAALPDDTISSLSRPQLRAYALWQYGELDTHLISRLWRDPPIRESTVAMYVLEAIKLERLPCDLNRAKLALRLVPKQLKDRFDHLWEDTGEDEDH